MSDELLLRTVGAAIVVVVEHEAPTRLVHSARSVAEEATLDRWLDGSPLRRELIALALADRRDTGGRERQEHWARELAGEQVDRRLIEAVAGEVVLRLG